MENCSVLFSNSEVNYIIGKKKCSKSFEYKIRSGIKKKINKLVSFELPFLIENGVIDKQLIDSFFNNIKIYKLPTLGKEEFNFF